MSRCSRSLRLARMAAEPVDYAILRMLWDDAGNADAALKFGIEFGEVWRRRLTVRCRARKCRSKLRAANLRWRAE